MSTPHRAVIYVPSANPDALARWSDECLQHCDVLGYEVLGIVLGTWVDVTGLIFEGAADLVVVARWEHPPPDRLPRLEVAGGRWPARCPRPTARRPRILH